ncbi:ArpA protein [Kibdelosporangium persicum]|uniref:L-lysine 4-chlorinase n=1 Tax=Kibdelosporangium persicum TaxID=2698649 RepID=A0ABX2FH03_9PSEU|nr:ArpA protein [Kibdelosporangium persicum]NRN70671.1 L-lysine 4-chlorinase [Kibdelosporangium persicum]
MSVQSITPSQLDDRLAEHIAERYRDPNSVRALSQHFRREGYVKLTGLVPEDLFRQVSDEVYSLIDLHARRIDLLMKETGSSPRYMSTVSQKSIAEDGHLIPAVYQSEVLTGFLSQVAAQPVVECPWEDEKYVIIRQHKKGDTHGWHWGDFSFTVIWIIEAPALEYGGMLQCVPHTDWDKENPRVHEYLVNHPIKTYAHQTGDLYFLRSDTTLHRTVPLNEEKTRIILNTCWGSESDRLKTQTHETMEAMFS